MVGVTNFPFAIDSHTGGNPKGFAEVVNLLSTQLSAGVSNVATTLPVISTTGFPSAGIVVIRDGVNAIEVVYYASKDATNLLSCTRGSDGTSAVAHNSAGTVANVPTAAMHNDLAAAIVAIENKLGGGISFPTNQTLLGGTGLLTSGWTPSPTVSGILTATGGLASGSAITGANLAVTNDIRAHGGRIATSLAGASTVLFLDGGIAGETMSIQLRLFAATSQGIFGLSSAGGQYLTDSNTGDLSIYTTNGDLRLGRGGGATRVLLNSTTLSTSTGMDILCGGNLGSQCADTTLMHGGGALVISAGATAGGGAALPATVVGFVPIKLFGTTYRFPIYL